jgi:hypothetical protein
VGSNPAAPTKQPDDVCGFLSDLVILLPVRTAWATLPGYS